MIATYIDATHISVPKRAESPGVIGDGLEIISTDHPDWEAWQPFITRPDQDEIELIKSWLNNI